MQKYGNKLCKKYYGQISSLAYLESSLPAALVSSPSTRSGTTKIEICCIILQKYFLNNLRGMVFSKSSSLKCSIFSPSGHSLTRSIFVSSPQQPSDWGTWHQAYLGVQKVSFPSLNDFVEIFCLQVFTSISVWPNGVNDLFAYQYTCVLDKGFYMLISTFYILAGLAFTSTIIEIIRQVFPLIIILSPTVQVCLTVNNYS